MAEELKDLIEKIQQEGVQAAESRAKEIENEARRTAQKIIDKAKAEADKLIAEAEDKIAKMQESTMLSLKQAGRDLLIGLRKDINAILDKLILSSVRQALNTQELTKIITALIKEYSQKKHDVIISLNKHDLEKLEKGFLGELSDELKKGIALKPSEDISAGFIISYDSGKTHFDFTDKAIAEYIGLYLKPKLGEIFQDIVP